MCKTHYLNTSNSKTCQEMCNIAGNYRISIFRDISLPVMISALDFASQTIWPLDLRRSFFPPSGPFTQQASGAELQRAIREGQVHLHHAAGEPVVPLGFLCNTSTQDSAGQRVLERMLWLIELLGGSSSRIGNDWSEFFQVIWTLNVSFTLLYFVILFFYFESSIFPYFSLIMKNSLSIKYTSSKCPTIR